MKKLLSLLLALIVLFLWGCSRKSTPQQKENAISMYQEFLAGRRSLEDQNEKGEVNIDDIFIGDGWDRYAFFDVNGDGIPELHIHRTAYYILACEDDGLHIWGSFPSSSKLLSSGDILIERLPGAGYYVSYDFIDLDLDSNEQSRIEFARAMPHMLNDEPIFDESSKYWFEGKEVSMEEWNILTEKYLSIAPAEIEWISVE